jgi:hypothetical protein
MAAFSRLHVDPVHPVHPVLGSTIPVDDRATAAAALARLSASRRTVAGTPGARPPTC